MAAASRSEHRVPNDKAARRQQRTAGRSRSAAASALSTTAGGIRRGGWEGASAAMGAGALACPSTSFGTPASKSRGPAVWVRELGVRHVCACICARHCAKPMMTGVTTGTRAYAPAARACAHADEGVHSIRTSPNSDSTSYGGSTSTSAPEPPPIHRSCLRMRGPEQRLVCGTHVAEHSRCGVPTEAGKVAPVEAHSTSRSATHRFASVDRCPRFRFARRAVFGTVTDG